MGKKKSILGKVDVFWGSDVDIEFGRTQADLWFSKNGSIQRYLKLKKGDKVKVTIEKL